jgi:hypothetical protein
MDRAGFESFCKGLSIAPYKTEVVRRLTISVFYGAIIIPHKTLSNPACLIHSFFYRKNSSLYYVFRFGFITFGKIFGSFMFAAAIVGLLQYLFSYLSLVFQVYKKLRGLPPNTEAQVGVLRPLC